MNFSVDQLHLLTLNVGFAHHDGDWNWKNVRSPFARIFYATEGEAKISIGSDLYPVTPGHLYFIPAFTEHSYICEASFSHYYIHVYEEQTHGTGLLDDWSFPIEVKAAATDLELIKRLCYINPFLKLSESNPQIYDNHTTLLSTIQLNRRRPFFDKVESRGILYVLMSRFLKQAAPKVELKDDRIHLTLLNIRKHLDAPLNIKKLADEACMSKDHFIRIFKRETGETPNVYVTSRKMEKAELLLVTTDLSIKSIATSLGYDDNSYFIRLFRKHTGLTPQKYREKNI